MPGFIRRIPAPLLALLAVCVIEAVTWCIVLPPLQGPDEDSHVAYVQKIVEAREIPWGAQHATGGGGRPYSTELELAEIQGDVLPTYGNLSARPAGTQLDERLWAANEARLNRRDRADGGVSSAMRNPPAYYLYEAVPYLVTSSAEIFDQLFVLRLANIPFLLVTVTFVWLIAGELLGRRRWLQTIATAAAALEPQLTHLTAVVNPDVALSAIWSCALYVMIVVLRRGLTPRRVAALIGLCVLSGFTHGRGLALVAPALLTLGLAAWKRRRPGVRPARRTALALTALAAAAFVYIALRGHLTEFGVRRLASYMWQFYLPRPDFLVPVAPDYGFRQVIVERLFGSFAQLEVSFSSGLNDVLWWSLIVMAVSAAVGVYHKRESLREVWDVAVVLVVAIIATFALLHVVAYRSLVWGSGDPIITGRYLLPLVAIYGVALALAVDWLPRGIRVGIGGAVVAALTLLQLGAIAITVERFYA